MKVVIHHFEEEVLFAEDVAILFGARHGFVKLLVGDELRNLATQTR
jgi:hypothetical protein